jgi:phosphoribosyl 1,2-cyclic phosphodiesterase
MIFHVLGTGSSGNGYLFKSSNEEYLCVEAGVRTTEIVKHTKGSISKVEALLLTHEHGDHSKHLRKYLEMGINAYSAAPTFSSLKLSTQDFINIHGVLPLKKYKTGSFSFMPFEVKHDAIKPYGYLINHSECGNVLFVTDTSELNYKFPNLDTIIIEVNFSDDIVEKRIEQNTINPFLLDRIKDSHFTLSKCIDFLNKQDLSNVSRIILIHLSDSNSDEENFRSKIEAEFGIECNIASNGDEFYIEKL